MQTLLELSVVVAWSQKIPLAAALSVLTGITLNVSLRLTLALFELGNQP
jgi:hypothetical protein